MIIFLYCALILYSLDPHTDSLTEEIGLDFTRAMNKILFDKIVTANPVTFPFVTLPEPEVVAVPDKGMSIHTLLSSPSLFSSFLPFFFPSLFLLFFSIMYICFPSDRQAH